MPASEMIEAEVRAITEMPGGGGYAVAEAAMAILIDLEDLLNAAADLNPVQAKPVAQLLVDTAKEPDGDFSDMECLTVAAYINSCRP